LRDLLKKWGLVLISPLAITAVLALLLVFVIDCSGTDVRGPGYVEQKSKQYLQAAPLELPAGESYALKKVEGPIDDWVLLTIARTNPSMGADTGSSGLIAIGHLEDSVWEFRLQGQDETFDHWLSELPEQLLSDNLKESFRTYREQLSVSQIPWGNSPSPRPAQEPVLYLPYPEKKAYQVSTLPGESYHKGSIQHAIDFDMPEGFLLAAVADGSVMTYRDDSKLGGCNEKYADDANYIRIKIAPGLAVLYLHLQADSIPEKVTKEKKVETGQIIGKSGSTGFTCNWQGTGPGPHLHIVLEKLCGQRICGSKPLNFAEFGSGDPRHRKAYVSQNKSPQDWAAEREREEIDKIKQVVAKYASIWGCGVEGGCDIYSHPDRRLTTSNLIQQIIDVVPVIGGKAQKADPIDWEVLEVELLSESEAEAEGKLFADVITARGSHHYEYLHIFIKLVKNNGQWKIDKRIKRCGFITDTEGNRLSTLFRLNYCEY
jgi:hypothetical protein